MRIPTKEIWKVSGLRFIDVTDLKQEAIKDINNNPLLVLKDGYELIAIIYPSYRNALLL